jgi:hypothetical protein
MGLIRITTKAAILYDRDSRQQCRQCARHSRLGRPALSTNQYPADAGVNSIQDQGTSHALLTDDSSKWVDSWHEYSGGDYNLFFK